MNKQKALFLADNDDVSVMDEMLALNLSSGHLFRRLWISPRAPDGRGETVK